MMMMMIIIIIIIIMNVRKMNKNDTKENVSGFGGLEIACWRVRTRPKPSDFLGRKIPQHAFLRRGSKAVGPMS